MEVKYPNIYVQLSGEDGNAFFILGQMRKELKKAGIPKAEIDEFLTEAKSGDFDHLLRTVMKTVETG